MDDQAGPDSSVCMTVLIQLQSPFITDLPRITTTGWTDLEVAKEWIKKESLSLILVAMKYCHDELSEKTVPVVLLHTYGQPQREQNPSGKQEHGEGQDTRVEQKPGEDHDPRGREQSEEQQDHHGEHKPRDSPDEKHEFRTYLMGTCEELGLSEWMWSMIKETYINPYEMPTILLQFWLTFFCPGSN